MLIANKKKESNIIEYLIYMWHIEDILRVYNFDISLIEKNIISKFGQSQEISYTIKNWYSELIGLMKNEGLTEKGHLKQLNDIVDKLATLNKKMLISVNDERYRELYYKALPGIKALSEKNKDARNEIELCIIGLYGVLRLKMNNKNINASTDESIKSFAELLSYLAYIYKNNN